MRKILEKLKDTKLALRCLREGTTLLEAQNTEAADFDDTWLIESKDLKWSFPIVARAIRKRQTKLVIYEPQKAEVFCGIQGDYANREYCEKNGIEVTPFPTQGGALVCNKGDLLIIFIHPCKNGEFRFLDFIKPRIINYLANYVGAENITTPNNDIEVNGKKISGSSTAYKMGSTMESLFINGVNNNTNLEAVGHKGKAREVTGLAEHGIDISEFKNWIIKTIQNAFNLHCKRPKGKGKGRRPRGKADE